MAEEIDASRVSRSNSPSKRAPMPHGPQKKTKTKGKKKSKTSKNVTFDGKKSREDSDEDDADLVKSVPAAQAAPPTIPDFVDVVENKG